MEDLSIIILFLFVLFLLLGSGVWIGLALMGVAWVGMELFTSRPVGDVMLTTIWTSSSSWTLTALPLFIWMGEILFRTRLSRDLFEIEPEEILGTDVVVTIVGGRIVFERGH